jgi:O-antigen ligase
VRELAVAAAYAAAAGVLVFIMPFALAQHPSFGGGGYAAAAPVAPLILPTEASSAERMVTLIGGWNMFLEHPIFGAGLGAFRNLNILATSGIPLVIHSTALWLLAELGLVGFLIFAVPGFYVWFSQWRLATRDDAAAIITLCFLGFAVMSGPADMVYQRTFWLMVGAALAVPLLQEARSGDASAPLPG